MFELEPETWSLAGYCLTVAVVGVIWLWSAVWILMFLR